MKLLRLLLQTSWVSMFWAAATGLMSGASSAGLIALINLTLRHPEISKTFLALSFIGLCVLLLITTAASQILIARLAEQVIFNLRVLLNQRILACPLRHLEEIGSPRLLATLTEDIEAISRASFAVSGLFVSLAILLGCLLYLCWLSVPVFLLMLGFMVVGVFSHQILITRGRKFLQLAREQQDQLFQYFRTTTEGMKELKLHHQRRQAFLLEDLQPAAAIAREYRVTGMDIFAIAVSWSLLLFFIPIGLLLFSLPSLTQIPISVLSGYALTIIFMITPLRGILSTMPDLSRANIALEKIEALGLSLAAHTSELNQLPPQSVAFEWKGLELAEVTHAYRGEHEFHHFTLGPINLTFAPKEVVFIIGGNGSGKSTLVKLIVGLYTPESGVIRLNGEPIVEDNREWYRQQFAVVFADFFLFERLLGFDQQDLDDHIQSYLEQLQLDHKVQVKQGVLSTTTLSQGQRKRLALLTAYLEDRPIYVFDEWASDQDPVFKDIFYTRLLPELKQRGKTVLVISHDDHYFHLADRLIKLDYGQVEYDKSYH